MFNIIIGLICVMTSNIFLGTSLATLKKNFNKTTFINGIVKALLIVVSVVAMYLCSFLNPDIMVANVNGQDVNLISAMELLFIAGIMLYGFKSLVKLRDLLKLKTNIEERNDKNE
ncbi:MAG: hypothetical protein HFI86_02245 [Bacilli bacterium]|nr:hypothetical protein [Bacilli bacterium]